LIAAAAPSSALEITIFGATPSLPRIKIMGSSLLAVRAPAFGFEVVPFSKAVFQVREYNFEFRALRTFS
jgi:hypothetical protein